MLSLPSARSQLPTPDVPAGECRQVGNTPELFCGSDEPHGYRAQPVHPTEGNQ